MVNRNNNNKGKRHLFSRHIYDDGSSWCRIRSRSDRVITGGRMNWTRACTRESLVVGCALFVTAVGWGDELFFNICSFHGGFSWLRKRFSYVLHCCHLADRYAGLNGALANTPYTFLCSGTP